VAAAHPIEARVQEVPLAANSVAAPRLVYGRLDPHSPAGVESAYPALYFDVADSADLGRVTFEGLDAVRAARGEHLPYPTDRYAPGDWVFVVDGSPWLVERHGYEMHHYSTSLLNTHRHYVFAFHDHFIEAIAEGIWLDIADRADPFAPPPDHPLAELPVDAPAELFTSPDGLTWKLRRSPRPLDDIIRGSRYCSQRLFQYNLTLDGADKATASIWIRTTNRATTSYFRFEWSWGNEPVSVDGIASPEDFADVWNTYLAGVAERRRRRAG
jgi:hypothetical protein